MTMTRPLLVVAFLCALMLGKAEDTCDANAVWEKMVEAKGGRERLDSIKTLYTSTTYMNHVFLSRHRIEERAIYRFPDFVWSWSDLGSAQLGVMVSQTYVDKGYALSVRGPSSHPKVQRDQI